MIVDAHYHLDPSIETARQLIARMDRSAVQITCLIAALVQPIKISWFARFFGSIMTRSMLGPMPQIGRFFCARMVTSDGHVRIVGRRYRVYRLPDNAAVERAVKAFPGRFLAWLTVNPVANDPIQQLEQCKDQPGWIGVKTHPFLHRYSICRLDAVAQWCQERSWPLLIHLGLARKDGDITNLSARYPRLAIIYAHAGVPFFEKTWRLVRRYKHVWIDLSNPIYVDHLILRKAVHAVGPARCIWGTDGPYDGLGYDHSLIAIEMLGLSGGDSDRILGQNLMDIIQPTLGNRQCLQSSPLPYTR
jgi:predicted TIM-barrel fold metal-dependent hydrolase